MTLVDSHCHLDYPDFADDLDGVIGRAADAGVGTFLTISTHITRFDGVLAVAERYPQVFCTVGIHPHEAASEPETTAARLVELARHPKVVGFGETGLDYFYEHSPRGAQARSFRVHIEAAREAGLPVVIHSRDADDDMIRILDEEQGRGRFAAVLHCFSSGRALAEAALAHGIYVSLSGIVTFRKAKDVQAVAKDLPADRLLVETDAPFLAPEPNRGKRNEPAFVALTAARLAKLRGEEADRIAHTTTANFFALFSKAAPG